MKFIRQPRDPYWPDYIDTDIRWVILPTFSQEDFIDPITNMTYWQNPYMQTWEIAHALFTEFRYDDAHIIHANK